MLLQTHLIRGRCGDADGLRVNHLPITPPALFAAPMRIGLKFNCSAVMRCNPPNSAFDDVSLPVNATPSQPMYVPKKGKNHPVRVNANLNSVHSGIACHVSKPKHARHRNDGKPHAIHGLPENPEKFF